MSFIRLFSPSEWARRCLRPSGHRKGGSQRRCVRLAVEILEDRTALALYTVTLATDGNPNGGGQQDPNILDAGDLRYCITQINAGKGSQIVFGNQVNGQTIDLAAALPDLSSDVTINPLGRVSVTVERDPNATTNFRIFDIDTGVKVTLGAFTIQKGLLQGDARNDAGAGIENAGMLTLNGTTVYQNTTDDVGGGIANLGSVTLNGAKIKTNTAVSGGGIYNVGTISTAPGAPVLSIASNQATDGAGIYNGQKGNLLLNKVMLDTNIAQNDGGGIYSVEQLSIQNSTFKNNQAVGGSGGGIYNTAGATIAQNTFTNNMAGLQGGAIKNTGNAVDQGKGNTINNNKVNGIPGVLAANETGGGISDDPGVADSIVNSIVAGNTAPTDNDVYGTFTDEGHNFIGDGTGGNFIDGDNGDQVGTSSSPLDPMLGSLQDNGGGIDTEMPLAGSPVIDAGDNSYAPAGDERGYQRIINNVVDLGAVESGSYSLAPVVSGLSPTFGPTTGGTTVTIYGSGFTNVAQVLFGGVAATSFAFNSDTQITAVSPAYPAGPVDVTVANTFGPSATTSGDQFTYQAPPPSITSISPTSGPTTGGTVVTITGSGFTGATQVTFGSTPAPSFTVNSDTSITATSPHGTGTVDITVWVNLGESMHTPADQFTYTGLDGPMMASVQPNASSSGTSGTSTPSHSLQTELGQFLMRLGQMEHQALDALFAEWTELQSLSAGNASSAPIL